MDINKDNPIKPEEGSYNEMPVSSFSSAEEDIQCRDFLLEFNDNRFYVAGYHSVIVFRITSLSKVSLIPRVTINSEILKKTSRVIVPPNQSRLLKFEVKFRKEDAGIRLFNVQVYYHRNNQPVVYTSQLEIKVMSLAQEISPHQIVLHLERLVNVEEGGKVMGNNIEILPAIKEIVQSGRIKSIDDLLEQDLADCYRSLPLEFDYDATEELRTKQTGCQTITGVDTRFNRDVPEITRASLLLEDEGKNIVIISKALVTFGRNRSNDIVLRILPRNENNDVMSRRITGDCHFRLAITDYGILLVDDKSSNRTYIDGKEIQKQVLITATHGRYVISVANCLDLALTTYPFNSPAPEILPFYLKALNTTSGLLWDQAGKINISSVKLERLNNLKNEEYIIFFNSLSIGSSNRNPLCLRGEGIDEIHCRILNFNNRFYLEKLTTAGELKVSGKPVALCSLVPLQSEMPIEIGRKKLIFRPYEQLHIPGAPETEQQPLIITKKLEKRGEDDFVIVDIVPPPEYKKLHAFCIGFNAWPYLSSITPLKYCVNDATEFGKLLQEKFNYTDVRFLTYTGQEQQTPPPDLIALKSFLNQITDIEQIGAEDAVVVLYSGHGCTVKLPAGGELGYLLPPAVNDPALLEFDETGKAKNPRPYNDQALPMNELIKLAQACPAKHVLFIVEACFGGLAFARGCIGISPSIKEAMRRPARQILTAGTAREPVLELPALEHGVLAYAVLKELKYTFKPLPVSEIFSKVRKTVPEILAKNDIPNRDIHFPQYNTLPGDEGGDLVFFPKF